MDKLKVKIDITEAWRALDRLEAALEQGDQRGAGNALYNIRQRLYMLQNELGIVRDLADLKSEIELSRARCRNCGNAIERGAAGLWRHVDLEPMTRSMEICGKPEPRAGG